MKVNGRVFEFCCDAFMFHLCSSSPTLTLEWEGIKDTDKKRLTFQLLVGADKYRTIKYCPYCGDEIVFGLEVMV